MKKSIGIKLFAFALLALTITACSKYEEGSKFTVLTKKARMVNTWTLSSYTVNDISQALGAVTSTMELSKDGKYVSTWSSGGFSSSEVGTWAFSSNKEELIVIDSSGNVETFTIVMLKNKDLKLKQVETFITTSITTVVTYTGA
ncbi:MAG: lipocalin family protein [Fluviicola sp.]|nr:lipocalin family protein [Fluviicola sp.]